ATLEKIRNKAGLLVTIVGLALFAFIIGDLLNSSNSFISKNQNNVVVVNGNAVDYQEYMNRENELTDVYKIQTGSSNLSESYTTQIRQSVFDEIVMENIIDPRLEKLGIVVTPEEMTDLVEGEYISPVLRQISIFQNQETGMFDRTAVINFLNQIKDIDSYPLDVQPQLLQGKALWMFWEKNIKRNRLNEKYTALLGKALVANSIDAKNAFDNTSENSDIVYVMERFINTADSTISVSKAEIEKLYNERKELFRQQEACVIDYITVDIVPSPADYSKVETEMNAIREELETTENVAALTNEKSDRKYINAFYSVDGLGTDKQLTDFVATAEVGDIEGPLFEDNKYRILKLIDKTVGPDSVKVSEILIAPRATEAETRVFADSLVNVLNKGGDFAEIAKQYSVDQLAQNEGDMGWMTEAGALSGINEEFKRTVFTQPVDQSAVVKSTYGLHIVKVTEKTKNVSKYKIADIVNTVTPSSTTRTQLYNALNQFIANNNSIEKIEAEATNNGYVLVPNARVYGTDITIGLITGARQVVRWAFNSNKGQISEINECDDKFVVAAMKGKLQEGYQSLNAVSEQLKTEIATRKKGEEIAANLKAQNLSSIEQYASAMNETPDTVKFITMGTSRITNIGIEPKLNALITAAPLNRVSEPVAGNNGVYVFSVTNRTQSNKTFDQQTEKTMLEAEYSYRIGSLLFRYLQQSAEIEDNRIRFY
ncbi:MAG: SurA N-terminal domain-containing protein, partial [Tannerella sp.]|nr:SurA N-terminal domain-containing protein [Tannerella sp.]